MGISMGTPEKARDSKPDVRALAETLAGARDAAVLRAALAHTDLDKLTANDASVLARALHSWGGAPDVKIAYLGNFTLDLLPRCVDLACAKEGLRAGAHLGKFDQYVQEVLDDSSTLVRWQPDVVLLALSLRLLRPDRMAAFPLLSAGERRELREEVAAHVESWATAALERLPATLLIANFPAPAWPLAGVADAKAELGETEFFLELNLDLLRRFKDKPRVRLFDVDRLAGRFGKERVVDRKMFYLAKMEWSSAFLPTVAGELAREVKAIRGLTRKCLVLDLDNTLWGGVVGEEGAAGIKIGRGDPEAEAFLDFHHRLKALQAQGVILAICSKNNVADVLEVFETRPEMPLQLADFAAREICWDPKHEGLRRIAATLNIGTDSLVFLDDNPAEVSLVAQMLPEVKAVLLPPDPAGYVSVLEKLNDFERLAVLAEDRQKTEQYRQGQERAELQAAAGDLGTYLASLRTELEIRKVRRDDLERVHQLFQKTNQFNVTTQRYSAAEVERSAASLQCELWMARARDRFGDLGTIAVLLLKQDGRSLLIDSLLMSCRAMGRGLETALLNHAKSRLLDHRGVLDLRACYVPTAKNKPVENLFEGHGFRLLEKRPGGEKLYVLGRSEAKLEACDWIDVLTEEMATR
jgi:FkbH-like protein